MAMNSPLLHDTRNAACGAPSACANFCSYRRGRRELRRRMLIFLRHLDRFVELLNVPEVLLRRKTATSAMGRPLVLNQSARGHDRSISRTISLETGCAVAQYFGHEPSLFCGQSPCTTKP